MENKKNKNISSPFLIRDKMVAVKFLKVFEHFPESKKKKNKRKRVTKKVTKMKGN